MSPFAVTRLGTVAAGTDERYTQNFVPVTDLAAARRATVETELLVYRHAAASSAAAQTDIERQIRDTDTTLDATLARFAPFAADPTAVQAWREDITAYRERAAGPRRPVPLSMSTSWARRHPPALVGRHAGAR